MRALAEVALLASNEGLFSEADKIIKGLEILHREPNHLANLQATHLFNQEKFFESADLLRPWCADQKPSASHALLGLVLWQAGKPQEAKKWLNQLLDEPTEDDNAPARDLAEAVLTEMRGHR